MNLKYTLAVAALGLTTATNAQTWINDTAHMTGAYAKNVYYSLENGSVKAEDANNWDIAIRYGTMTAGVFANHAGSAAVVYPLTGLSAADKFGDDLTADTVGHTGSANALYNSIETWEEGAFNADGGSTQFDFGWGNYDMASHWVIGDKIYLVVTSTGAYQVWIETVKTFNSTGNPVANPPTWIFHVANLDGTNRKDKELEMKPTYENKLFAYYKFSSDAFVNRDPDNSAWDILFTQYYEDLDPSPGTMFYKVTGVLSNDNRPVVRLTGTGVQGTAWNEATMAPQFDTAINVIGRDWKGSTSGSGYNIKDSMTYFVKVANGDIWQLEFTYATQGATTDGSEPGAVGLRKRKVFTNPPAAIKEVNAFVGNMLVVPNPVTNGSAYVLVDAKQNINDAVLTITDINGRIMLTANKNIKAGLQQLPVNVSQYTAGMYMINLSGAGFRISQKLVVQ